MGGNWIRSRGSGHHGGVTASQRGGRDTKTHALSPPHELRNDKGYFSYLFVLPTTGPVINGYGLHASEMQSGAGYCGQRQGSWKGGQVSTPLGLTGKLRCVGGWGRGRHSTVGDAGAPEPRDQGCSGQPGHLGRSLNFQALGSSSAETLKGFKCLICAIIPSFDQHLLSPSCVQGPIPETADTEHNANAKQVK